MSRKRPHENDGGGGEDNGGGKARPSPPKMWQVVRKPDPKSAVARDLYWELRGRCLKPNGRDVDAKVGRCMLELGQDGGA